MPDVGCFNYGDIFESNEEFMDWYMASDYSYPHCEHCGEVEDGSVGLYLNLNDNGICEECAATGVVSVNR